MVLGVSGDVGGGKSISLSSALYTPRLHTCSLSDTHVREDQASSARRERMP